MDIASRINQGLRDVSLWKGGLGSVKFDDKSFDKRTENAKQEDSKMSSQKLKETM